MLSDNDTGSPALWLWVILLVSAYAEAVMVRRPVCPNPRILHGGRMSAQYDAVAEQYDATFQAFPVRIYIEEWSVLKTLGDVQGKSVLELATGTGHYARRMKQLGASRVVGVDLSPEMIGQARAAEERAPLDITYHVGDVSTLDLGETFDVVLAVYLLHYAPNAERLDAMARTIARHLEPGGQLVTHQLNPDFSRAEGYYERYGIRLYLPSDYPDGQAFSFSPVLGGVPWPPITLYYWHRATLTAALERAGLTNVRWHEVTLDPRGIESHGAEHWQAYLDQPHCVPIEATKV
ncbi:MAG: class I SAM-dependent methyltransferase [Minicystis sp.]